VSLGPRMSWLFHKCRPICWILHFHGVWHLGSQG
jgi:hypothetical protein